MAAIELIETDYGTKKKTRKVISKIQKGKGKMFHRSMLKYINKVLDDAKRLCPVDTGTLQSSIRLITREAMGKGSFIAGRDITEEFYIIAGGPPYFNPKHKRFCDYAQAVHDGTLRMPARPFLTDALAKNKAELDKITGKYIQWINETWSGPPKCPPRRVSGWSI